ncbi:hypothetical protein EMPS_03176 [Entomortierella parvispora]|uniref:Uncharacterized protein n=1 Tax=Entomortierella parvispora TaxID=205924 RepID=A0A9P3LU61_9FUNG|nr:hypothetical protein EMPS_03176 [Entomortierella parvispora]
MWRRQLSPISRPLYLFIPELRWLGGKSTTTVSTPSKLSPGTHEILSIRYQEAMISIRPLDDCIGSGIV